MNRRIAAGLTFVAVLLSMEGLCRFLVWSVPPRYYRDPGSDTWRRLRWVRNRKEEDGVGGPTPYLIYNSSRGWSTRPNLRRVGIGMAAAASTNSQGLRAEEEHEFGCRAGRKRLLVLGDSFVFGEEVADRETFSSRLERLIPGIEVINLGVGGYGHDQMLLYLWDTGRRYCLDLILLAYLDADRPRNSLGFRDFAKPFFESSGDGLRLRGRPVPPPQEVLRRHRRGPRLLDLAELVRDRLYHRTDPTPRILDLIGKHAASTHARFAMLHASDGMTDDAKPVEEFLRYCRGRAVDCLVVDPYKAGKEPGYRHWSPRQHAAVARQLAPFISRLLAAAAP